MRYTLRTAESQEKIGEVFLDEPPEVGHSVSSAGATYRVTGIAWTGTADSNSVSCGDIFVKRVTS